MSIRCKQSFHKSAVQPLFDRSRTELATVLDHAFKRIRQLEFTLRADIVLHEVVQGFLECLDILDIINTDNSFVRNKFLWLFHKTFDTAILVRDSDTETLRIFHLERVKDVIFCTFQNGKVSLEQRIAEDNQKRFIIIYIRESKTNSLTQALRIGLHHSTDSSPFRFLPQKIIDYRSFVPCNKNSLGRF